MASKADAAAMSTIVLHGGDAFASFDVRSPDLRARFDADPRDPALSRLMGLAHRGRRAVETGDEEGLRTLRDLVASLLKSETDPTLRAYLEGFADTLDRHLRTDEDDDPTDLAGAVTTILAHGTDAEARKLLDKLRAKLAELEAAELADARERAADVLGKEHGAGELRAAIARLEEATRMDARATVASLTDAELAGADPLRAAYFGGACMKSCKVARDPATGALMSTGECTCERVAGIREGIGGPKTVVEACTIGDDDPVVLARLAREGGA